jgi:hypothetical protein
MMNRPLSFLLISAACPAILRCMTARPPKHPAATFSPSASQAGSSPAGRQPEAVLLLARLLGALTARNLRGVRRLPRSRRREHGVVDIRVHLALAAVAALILLILGLFAR